MNQEATIKKYYRKEGRIELHPANATMRPILVNPEDEFAIEGLVIGVIRYCEYDTGEEESMSHLDSHITHRTSYTIFSARLNAQSPCE